MKVIGEGLGGKYLCEIDHTELEKYLGTYYGKTQRLKVGAEVDLGRGYDYTTKIERAFEDTQKFVKSHKSTIDAIMSGLTVLSTRVEVGT